MGPGLSVSRRNQWHRDGIGADVRWRSCAINKRLGEVISNLATVFLFVTLLGKQSASQEGLGIGRQKFKGDAGVMGWRQEGIWLGQGSCCPQLSCPCPSQPASSPRSGGHQEERKEREEGVQIQAVDRRSLEEGRSLHIWECVFCDSTHCHPLPSPVLTHTGTAWPDVPLASDIFICSEQSLLREGDPRDAPEQILTSSIRSLWCAEARARGRHPSAGWAQSAGSAESIEEWEDTEEQTGQTLSQTWRLCNTVWGQGNLHPNDEGYSREFM